MTRSPIGASPTEQSVLPRDELNPGCVASPTTSGAEVGSSNASLRPTPKSADTKAEPSAAFTPEPWRVDGHTVYGDPDRDGWTAVCKSPCPNSPTSGARYRQWLVDARLIAAAPDQHAALNYVADMTYCRADGEWHFKSGYDPQVVLDAIAKALGPSAQDTSARSDLARDEPPQVSQPIREEEAAPNHRGEQDNG